MALDRRTFVVQDQDHWVDTLTNEEQRKVALEQDAFEKIEPEKANGNLA